MIYIGTCGFSYKDWIGPFYPTTIKPAEMLPYYAARFSAVEIDASYYGVPAERTIEAMAARTPANFRFCFKVPQSVTHGPDVRALVHDDARLFGQSLRPMLDSNKLGCVLAQFPNGFRPTPDAQTYVRRVAEALAGLPLVVEFRHTDWQAHATFELLRDIRAGWCNVDMPSLESLPGPSSETTSAVGYVRFHGRNAKQWWTGTNVTRYAYDYNAGELHPWTDRIAEIDEQAEKTYAFFNNHARGNAARNAAAFYDLLESRYGDHAARTIAAVSAPVAGTQQRLFEA